MENVHGAHLARKDTMQLRYQELDVMLNAALWNGEIYGDYLFVLQRQAIDLAAQFYAEFGVRITDDVKAAAHGKRGTA